MVVEMPHPTAGKVKVVNSPVKMSRTPVKMRYPPPLLGEHTGEILTGLLGYTPEEVASLRAEGVV
jgi:formyl-CoA transferase